MKDDSSSARLAPPGSGRRRLENRPPGRRVFLAGNYRMIRPLGRGGSGKVYLCEHAGLRARVAVKLVRVAPGPAAAERFFREACAAFDHPNIVRVFEVGRHGRLFYSVMEYVDGVTLGALVRAKGPLPVGQAVAYARQAARGLHCLHKCGWIHGDIKPENLMVTRDGALKLIDLGTAQPMLRRWSSPSAGIDRDLQFGTLDYLPPEQVSDPACIDGRADVYSLGATLYYLLTALSPCPGGDVIERILHLLTADIQPLHSLRSDATHELSNAVHKMLSRNIQDRFQHMLEVLVALAPWEAHDLKSSPDRI